MAQDTVDALGPYVKKLGRVRTKKLRLHGFTSWRPTSELERHLYQRYGGDTLELLSLINDDPSLAEAPIEGQPYIGAEFVYGVQSEMATSLVDLLTRRTRAHLHDARATLRAAPAIARIVAGALGWSDSDCDYQVAEYQTLVHRELLAAGLTIEGR
jgi:glycerol-3-phosphate dehydrogenase